MLSRPDEPARTAPAAEVSGSWRRLAIDGSGELHGQGLLPDPVGAGEEIGMRESPRGKIPPQEIHRPLVSDKFPGHAGDCTIGSSGGFLPTCGNCKNRVHLTSGTAIHPGATYH
jgi:hypothetical protein